MGDTSLKNFASFGDVAAEEDSVLDYFIATNAVQKVKDGQAFLILGRKGTGKTAIVRHFTEGTGSSNSKPLNLRGYIHGSRIDRGASDIEAYVSSWRYLIAVQLAAIVLAHPRSSVSLSSPPLRKFLNDNYGGPQPQLADVLRPSRLNIGKFSLTPSIMGNSLGGVDLDRGGKDHKLGLELNALTDAVMKAVFEVSADANVGAISLHFDELDQGLYRIDEVRSKMMVGLVLAAREVRRESLTARASINPVVYLRSDIWEDLDFSDKNKISRSLTLHLEWNSGSLMELVDRRLRAKLGDAVSWSDIIDGDLMRGSQPKWNHILARTFERPRDVISFLNISLAEAKKRSNEIIVFENKDIVSSRDEYSTYLKEELDDEIKPHWPFWEEALRACSAISTLTFERGEFDEQYEQRRSPTNTVTTSEALAQLYRFSAVGYERRSGYGGTSWTFQYADPASGWDNAATKFKIHLGLKEYAKLRETRQVW